MATQLQILKALYHEPEPVNRQKLAEKLGESSYRGFQTQLDRWVTAGLLTVTEEHDYAITDLGEKKMAEEEAAAAETDEEKLGTTEYQKFISFGKKVGVTPPELIAVVTDHIWEGGDFRDLEWVAKGLSEMGVRKDERERWFHRWRSYLNQPIPAVALEYLHERKSEAEIKAEAKSKAKDGGRRDYILDEDDKPIYVGEGLGDLDKDEAVDLARIRGGRGSRTAALQPTPGSMADDMVKLFAAFQQFMGAGAQGKSWVMRQGGDGNVQIEEAEPGRPMVISYPQGSHLETTKLVTADGEVQDVQPGQPIIIKMPAPAQPASGVQYIVDKATGQVTQVQPGQPIVIQASAPPQSPYTPIQMKDKDGNPMILDLSTFIRLEEHRDKQRRDEESHQTKMEIATGFKDLLKKASEAVSDVVRSKEKEE